MAAFALDKARARRGARRLRERTLLGLALLGGWPGAFAARRLFRHKTLKAGFSASLRLVAVLHVAAAGLLLAAAAGRPAP